MTPRRVLVTDASRGSALAVIRALGRRGDLVMAADTTAGSIGAVSRYAVASGTYPSPFDGPAAATAEAVADLARSHRADLVIAVTDDAIVPLIDTEPRLPAGCVVAGTDPGAFGVAADKVATFQLATKLDIPVPEGLLFTAVGDGVACDGAIGGDGGLRDDGTTVQGVIERLGSPVVVKPARSRRVGDDGRLHRGQVCYAADAVALRAAIVAAGQQVVVQRYHAGVGHGIGMVLDRGRPLVAVQHRRIHEVPITGGASALRETVTPDPALLDHAFALLGAMRWSGAAMAEFKIGPDGAHLMEVNGRLWGSMPLAVRAGADIPGLIAAVALGEVPVDDDAPVDTSYRTGVRARNLDLELVWIASVLRGGLDRSLVAAPTRGDAVRAIGGLFRRGQGDDLLSRRDLRPAVPGIRHAVSHVARKVRRGR